jgi:ubiquinone/menaquinone biosynthesis C-methylase UbiE
VELLELPMSQTLDPIYNLDNVPLFEAIYGKNLISLGGHAAIENMFSDLNINGLSALDLGFGLGGVAFYLAKSHGMKVTGIEVHSWMVKYAQTHTPKNIASLLKFEVYDEAGEMPFKTASFDIVYSKGVLNHVRDKDILFHKVNAILKPNGLFVIADWIQPQATTNSSDFLVNETQESYQKVLEESGFKAISFRDDSAIFLTYVKNLLANITEHQEYIENEYGIECFSTIWQDHQTLADNISNKRKIAARIMAKK